MCDIEKKRRCDGKRPADNMQVPSNQSINNVAALLASPTPRVIVDDSKTSLPNAIYKTSSLEKVVTELRQQLQSQEVLVSSKPKQSASANKVSSKPNMLAPQKQPVIFEEPSEEEWSALKHRLNVLRQRRRDLLLEESEVFEAFDRFLQRYGPTATMLAGSYLRFVTECREERSIQAKLGEARKRQKLAQANVASIRQAIDNFQRENELKVTDLQRAVSEALSAQRRAKAVVEAIADPERFEEAFTGRSSRRTIKHLVLKPSYSRSDIIEQLQRKKMCGT